MITIQKDIPIILGLIIVLLCAPVSAADNSGTINDSTIAIQQAHLAWVALEKDVEMNTAITYTSILYGTNTGNMTRLLSAFKKTEALIPSITTADEIDSLIMDMRSTTSQFRDETNLQMTIGQGKWDDLGRRMTAAKEENLFIAERKNNYWSIRRTNQMNDFYAHVQRMQGELDTLTVKGYDTTGAQRALDVISSRRPDVQAALESKTEARIQSMNQELLSLSGQLASQVTAVQGQVPYDTKIQFFIEQGYRAVDRAEKTNYDLTVVLIEIGPADPILIKLQTDLVSTRNVLSTGNIEAAKTPLKLVKKDLKDLALAYTDLMHSANLPPDLAKALNSMALTLDSTADQMDVT